MLSTATGIDNMSHKLFWKIIDEQIAIISRKAYDGTYRFTKYKLKLISKGRGKIPRDISIPTIRDRIALKALCNFLQSRFLSTLDFMLPQQVIKEVKHEVASKKYTAYIKLDVSNFYPSIKHAELSSRIKKRIKDKEILNLMNQTKDLRLTYRMIPRQQEILLGKASIEDIGDISFLNIEYSLFYSLHRLTKRVFDLTISLLTLIIFSPIILLLLILT